MSRRTVYYRKLERQAAIRGGVISLPTRKVNGTKPMTQENRDRIVRHLSRKK